MAILALVFGFSVFSSFEIPDTAFFGGDTWEYQSIAVNFASGEGFRFGALLPFEAYKFDSADPAYYDYFIELGATGGEPSTFRTPGYPFVLGVIYTLFGVSPRIAITIQIGWLILISALLPFLGRGLLGRGGFAAGLLAGLVFHRLAFQVGGRILTEALIALVLFLVLAAWIALNRTSQPSVARAIVFGLTLAAAVLTKGSLIFLPPLFLGYMSLQVWRKRRYRASLLAACALAFALPVAAYSVWATQTHGSFVLLSRQGPSVLLAGHNEAAVETGGWSPQWKEDPDSFFNLRLAADPGRSPVSMIAAFYAEHPFDLFRSIPRKLVAMFGTKTSILLAVIVVFEIAVLATCLVRRQTPQRIVLVGALLTLGVLATSISDPRACALIVLSAFGTSALFGVAAARSRCVRQRMRGLCSPGWIAVSFVLANFVLVALVFFGDPRFFAPARFVLILVASFLVIRMVAGLVLPVDVALTLDAEDLTGLEGEPIQRLDRPNQAASEDRPG